MVIKESMQVGGVPFPIIIVEVCLSEQLLARAN